MKMESARKGKKKNIPKSVNEMSKEMLQETLKKKKECNAKALQTVEALCEVNVSEEWFLENLQFINQTHFDDVTVERAITKLCGYPLCSQKLEKIPTQQYHISTRYNKVFDITERKNFCSSSCYKSAAHVKNQLFTSPLWFRDQEVIPKYTILKSTKSSLGEEIVFFPDKIKLEDDDDVKKKESEVKELIEKCSNLTIDDSPCVKTVVKTPEVKMESETQEKTKGNKTKVKMKDVDCVTKVEDTIFEWFSLDTIFYLYGEEKLKELFSDKVGKLKEICDSKLVIAGSSEKMDKVIRLYGLLDTDFYNAEIKENLKPLPDYSALKEEGKNLEIKVRAFYQGQLEVKEGKKKEEEEKKEESCSEDNPVYLPLIDAHAQAALRRKIVLDKLNKVLPDIIRIFSTDYNLQMSEVRNLVSTFSLSAHNITFKPSEWYLIAIILIKLMSLKDENLGSVLNLESSQSQILVLLKSFELEKDYLDKLAERLTDSESLLRKLNDINR